MIRYEVFYNSCNGKSNTALRVTPPPHTDQMASSFLDGDKLVSLLFKYCLTKRR